jgi:hypothetical protein
VVRKANAVNLARKARKGVRVLKVLVVKRVYRTFLGQKVSPAPRAPAVLKAFKVFVALRAPKVYQACHCLDRRVIRGILVLVVLKGLKASQG